MPQHGGYPRSFLERIRGTPFSLSAGSSYPLGRKPLFANGDGGLCFLSFGNLLCDHRRFPLGTGCLTGGHFAFLRLREDAHILSFWLVLIFCNVYISLYLIIDAFLALALANVGIPIKALFVVYTNSYTTTPCVVNCVCIKKAATSAMLLQLRCNVTYLLLICRSRLAIS